MILITSIGVCFIASRPNVRTSTLGGLLIIIGAPVLFIVVLFSEGGMLLANEGDEVGLPVLMRAYPMASDFLTTYIALGASYFLSRQACGNRIIIIKAFGWIESAAFALVAGLELILLARRVFAA